MGRKEEGKYCYCIIETNRYKKFGAIGIGDRGDEVYTVRHRDLAMVVSDTPNKVYTPSKEFALAHENVISQVMKKHTVLPISFGVVFKSDKDIRLVLQQTYVQIKEVLHNLHNKIELGLKVFWKKECFVSEIEKSHRDIPRLKAEIAAKPASKTYYEKIKLGSLVHSVVEEKRTQYEQEIGNPLKEMAVDARFNNSVGERMVLNTAFLVERDREKEFDEKVNELFLKYGDWFVFKYTGPWPPYNFVNIKLKLQ